MDSKMEVNRKNRESFGPEDNLSEQVLPIFVKNSLKLLRTDDWICHDYLHARDALEASLYLGLHSTKHPCISSWGAKSFKVSRTPFIFVTSVVEPEPRANLIASRSHGYNCGFGSSSGSGSFLITTDLKKFYFKKSWLLKSFL